MFYLVVALTFKVLFSLSYSPIKATHLTFARPCVSLTFRSSTLGLWVRPISVPCLLLFYRSKCVMGIGLGVRECKL